MHYQSPLFVLSDESSAIPESLLAELVRQADKATEIHILCVLPEVRWPSHVDLYMPDNQVVKESLTKGVKAQYSAQLARAGVDSDVTVEVRFGHLYLETINYVHSCNIDLVIKQAEDPEWSDYLFDSEDMHLLRKCPVPVWLMKEHKQQSIEHIAVAVDFDHDCEDAEDHGFNKTLLRAAIDIALQKQATLHVINVYNASYAGFASMWADNPEDIEKSALQEEKITRRAAINSLFQMLSQEADPNLDSLKYRVHLEQGNPKQDITRIVKSIGAELMVMGSVGRTGIMGLIIGNTAESVLLQLDCAVFVMKPKGFVSPVSNENK